MSAFGVSNHTRSVLTVQFDEQHHELHAVWLRDACTCIDCRNPVTNERLVDSSRIPLDLGIVGASVVEDRIEAELSDGHRAQCGIDWLVRHLTEFDRSNDPAAGRDLWDATSGQPIPTFERADLDDPNAICRWLDAITQHGAAIVRGVEPSDAGLREVAALVGEIRATNYGVTWTIEATVEPVTAVESERSLRVHTDLPYRVVAPGVQFLLAAVTDVDGGASTLVDGYAIAERIRHDDPDAWRLLTDVEFSYPFVRGDVEFHGRAPLFGLHSNGTYFQIRRAPGLVGAPFVDASSAPDLYRALRVWTDLVDHPDFEIQVALQPGELLALDNHRLLHGRTTFELRASGRRLLYGCYLDVEDLRSRRAVVGRAG